MDDTFRGDDAHLVRSIEAHLALDAAGALVPHGVGGLARVLLASAAARLSAALARSGQAASGSSQGARSDEAVKRFGIKPWSTLAQLKDDEDLELYVQARIEAGGVGQPEAPTAAPLTDEHFWLIERGPNQGQSPHCWWSADEPTAGMPWRNGEWVYDATKATRYATKADADIAAQWQRPGSYAVTSHGLIAHPPARSGAGSEEGGHA